MRNRNKSVHLIQNIDEVRKHSSEQIFMDKFPTIYWAIRFELKDIKQRAKNGNHNLKFPNSSFLDSYFLYSAENRKGITETPKSFLKKTKRNLRKALENEFREKRIIFYLGQPHTILVYRNSIFQSFFEFSLFYSWVKKTEVSADKSKIIFIELSKVSLGVEPQNTEHTQIFEDFLHFSQGNSIYFDMKTFPELKQGRPEKYKETLEMHKKGYSFPEIVNHFYKIDEKDELEKLKIEYADSEHSENIIENLMKKNKQSLHKVIDKAIRDKLHYKGYKVSNGKIIEIKN